MFLTEYDQEKVLAYERLEVEEQTNERVATDMLMEKKYPLSDIKKISRLSEDVILNLANSLGVTAI